MFLIGENIVWQTLSKNCRIFLFAYSQNRSTDLFACPSMSLDHEVVFAQDCPVSDAIFGSPQQYSDVFVLLVDCTRDRLGQARSRGFPKSTFFCCRGPHVWHDRCFLPATSWPSTQTDRLNGNFSMHIHALPTWNFCQVFLQFSLEWSRSKKGDQPEGGHSDCAPVVLLHQQSHPNL